MTIGEYIKQYPNDTFSIEYYFDTWCEKCHTSSINLDEEYSFDVVAADIGTTGYDWIFDIDVDNDTCVISDKVIKIMMQDTTIECEKCQSE